MASGRFEGGAHWFNLRVYYEDTDAAGIVYYANYLKFAERARTEALRLLGIHQSDLLRSEQIGFVVTRCEIDFVRPATLDARLTVETQLRELGKARMCMHQIIRAGDEVLARLVVHLAALGAQQKPVRIPETVAQALRQTFHANA